jgi:NAD(P)-dependent dehydrogenase (short-subunit alcohol dehydrogenase family)
VAQTVRGQRVALGPFDTPLAETWEAVCTLWRAHSPMRRAATPAEIARCVTSLIDSDYLIGEVLLSDLTRATSWTGSDCGSLTC